MLHRQDSNVNFAVIELKIARRNYWAGIEADFRKLAGFRQWLSYSNLLEVLIGTAEEIGFAFEEIPTGEAGGDSVPIDVIFFNTSTWAAQHRRIFRSE